MMNRSTGAIAPTLGLLAWALAATPTTVNAQESHGDSTMNGAQMDGMDMGGMDMGGTDMGGTDMGGMDMGGMDMDASMDMGGMEMGGGMDMGHEMHMGGMNMEGMADAPQFVHAIHMASQQGERLELLMRYLLLVALEVDQEANLRRLRATRDMFNQVQHGLRDGDGMLGLQATSNPEVSDSINIVDEEWAQIAMIIQHCLDAGHVTPEQVRSLALFKPRLVNELANMAEKIGFFSLGRTNHSILTTTTDVAQSQLTLLGQMTNQYLLIAYGQDEESHRTLLHQSYIRFDRALNGLIAGDAELQVLAAPTPGLRNQYAEIARMWRECGALIVQATATSQTDTQVIMQVTAHASSLAQGLEEAVRQYHNL